MKSRYKIPKWLHSLFKLTEESKGKTDLVLDERISRTRYIIKRLWPDIRYIIKRKILRFFRYQYRKLLLITIIIAGISYGANIGLWAKFTVFMNFEEKPSYTVKKVSVISYPSDSTMNLPNYLLQLAYGESRYIKESNRTGSQYWGLYQIGETERKIAGYGDIPKDVFLKHQEIQDLCMINLLKYNKKYMQKYIEKYNGRIIDGILVTESGILALCQLGCGAAMNYLDYGVVPIHDSNGNQPRNLLKLGGYKLNLEKIKYSIND